MSNMTMLAFNIVAVTNVMKKHGIDCVEVSYSGESGFTKHSHADYDAAIKEKVLCKVQGMGGSPIDYELSFATLLAHVTQSALLFAGHGGWAKGMGGKGAFSITSKGEIALDHVQNIVTVQHSSTGIRIKEDGNLTVKLIASKEPSAVFDDDIEESSAPAPG